MMNSNLLSTEDSSNVSRRVLNFNPNNRIAWAWFFMQAFTQLYAATYFGCMAKLAELPTWTEWLFWPTVIASGGVNYLLHVTCGQASYRLLEDYYTYAKTIYGLHQTKDASSYLEAVSLSLEVISVSSIAALSVVPFISIDEAIEDVCPFFSGPAILPLTLFCFFWVGFPASAAALPWVSAPVNTLLQTIAGSFRLTDYFPGLYGYWGRRGIALPLDEIQEVISTKLNEVYWHQYDFPQSSGDLDEVMNDLEDCLKAAKDDLEEFNKNRNKEAIALFLSIYDDNKAKYSAKSPKTLERTLYFLVGLISYLPYFEPVAQDEDLHPIIILASILVCSFLCVIAANSVSSIFRSFFPEKNQETQASYYYHYRTLSRTLASLTIFLIFAAFLSAAPCLGISQNELLENIPSDSWFSISTLIFFTAGTTIFNFAFSADSLQEATNLYYLTKGDTFNNSNITSRHVLAISILREMIRGLKGLPAEESQRLIHSEQNLYVPMEDSPDHRRSFADSIISSTTSASLVSPENQELNAILTQYTPPDCLMARAELLAIFVQLMNLMVVYPHYQQTQHGLELYAVNVAIGILCNYLIPANLSLKTLGKVMLSSLVAITVGLSLDQLFFNYLLGSLSTNNWKQLDLSAGNNVISRERALLVGGTVAALFAPQARKWIDELIPNDTQTETSTLHEPLLPQR